MAVELAKTSLANLTEVEVRERARVAIHPVPGLSGDLSQTLGRSSVEVALRGIFYGPDAADKLGQLRAVYLAGKPVDFFADAVGEGYFSQVLVTRLDIAQCAGELDQFTFACELIEYVVPPEPAAPSLLPGIDAGLLDEAAGFMDDVQNAIEEVSQLADLLGSIPSFGNPTERLKQMPEQFETLSGGAATLLGGIRGLF
jgi:hypothetical protein